MSPIPAVPDVELIKKELDRLRMGSPYVFSIRFFISDVAASACEVVADGLVDIVVSLHFM